MLKFWKNAAFVVSVCVGFGAHAATVTEAYQIETTLNKLSNPVGFGWNYDLGSGLSATFNVKDPGSFQIFDDGTAAVSATVYNDNDMNSGFVMNLNMDSTFLLAPTFKASFPDVMAHGNEKFFDPESGTVSGFGVLDGFDFTIGRFPTDGSAPFQYGGGLSAQRGTNQHNGDFGFSVWLQALTVTSSSCAICTNPEIVNIVGEQFDLVGNLQQVSTVPLPAGSLLLLTGLGAMGVMRRRRT